MGTAFLLAIAGIVILAIFGNKAAQEILIKGCIGCIWFLVVAVVVFLLLDAVDPVR